MTRLPDAAMGQPDRPVPDGRALYSSSDARDFLQATWSGRRSMFVAAVVLAGAGAVGSLLPPRRYEASLTLAVLPSQVVGAVVSTVPPQELQKAVVANFVPI